MATRVMATLWDLEFEVVFVNISVIEDAMVHQLMVLMERRTYAQEQSQSASLPESKKLFSHVVKSTGFLYVPTVVINCDTI